MIDRASGALENVSKQELNVYRPVWSADGRHIIGVARDDNDFKALRFNLFGTHQELFKSSSGPVEQLRR